MRDVCGCGCLQESTILAMDGMKIHKLIHCPSCGLLETRTLDKMTNSEVIERFKDFCPNRTYKQLRRLGELLKSKKNLDAVKEVL